MIWHRQSVYPKVSGTFDSYPVLTATLHSSSLTIFTCHHCLTFKPRDYVWIPYQDRTSLLKHIKPNVLWFSSIFCSIIIIFICLSLLSSHYHKCSALTTRCFYFWSVITAFRTENSTLFWTLPCISKIQLELMPHQNGNLLYLKRSLWILIVNNWANFSSIRSCRCSVLI